MAYTKILVVHNRLDKSVDYAQNKDKTTADPLELTVTYALNREKTEATCFETAVNCDPERVYDDMMDTKRRWDKVARKRKGYHIIQSFAPGEVTPEEAHGVGVELAQRLLGDRYEVIVTTHLDKAHLHNHIVFNSVSFVDGAMYRDTMKDYYQGIREISDAICQEQGLSVIEPFKKGQQYSEWDAQQKGRPTIREGIRREVDLILQKSYTYKSFLRELERRGYEVKTSPKVKHTAIRPPGSCKFVRLDSLGAGYTEADLKARLEAIRQGEVQPIIPVRFPPSPILTPGRHYRVPEGIRRHRPRRLTGFQALYFKYLYLLRGIKAGRPQKRTAFFMREELIKFDRYQRQFQYLHQNRIETPAQLAMQYDALQAEIDTLTDQRAELYRRRRRGEDVEGEIAAITAALRPLRRELRLCVQIEADIPIVNGAVQKEREQRSKTNEKADKHRPDRDIEPDPDLSTRSH